MTRQHPDSCFEVVFSDVMWDGLEEWLTARGLYLYPIPVQDDLPTYAIGISDRLAYPPVSEGKSSQVRRTPS